MVFSGYRLPKPITTVGTVLGTNPGDLYTIGAKDPRSTATSLRCS